MSNFIHLHVHSHYSVLDGMSKVPELVNRAMECGMYSIALTDHGNMFGIKELIDYTSDVNKKTRNKIKEQKGILENEDPTEEEKATASKEIKELESHIFKPIVGVEAYCARRTLYKKEKDYKTINPENGHEQVVDASGYHLILLAKNKTGYQNLCKIITTSWVDGYYHRPRIDKNILKEHHEGIIVSSACLGGEIPQLIIGGKMDEAEKSIRWFKDIFGDDYYLEIQRHQTDKPNAETTTFSKQQKVIPKILELAKKTNTKVIATNDVHFVREEHAEAHDRLICLSTGKDLDDPNRMRYTKQEWLKTPEEMSEIFADIPESISNTLEIAEKVESFTLDSSPIMPMFDIPKEFGTEEEYHEKYTEKDLFNEFTQDEKRNVVLSQEEAEKKIKKLGGYKKLYRIKLEADYLAKLAWDGAAKRYNPLTDEVKDRIIFELHVMKTMGFPGYFLIVMDYIRAAREELGVSVGPGRGSAAGSVVAYCLKITDIDPLKYDLLFERFLNPDRISLPDIDVDFDDDGRGKVLQWVTDKYGKDRVAHIITYGTMATKSSIKDVGRVQKVPLAEVNRLTSFVPDKFGDNLKDPKTEKVPKVNLKNCFKYVPELQDAYNSPDKNISSMLHYAEDLEDTIRQIGIHACGVIIGADSLTKFAPLCTVKDKDSGLDVLVTQYDGHVIESVGLIKMDFLGLKTLSILKEALKNIKKAHNIDVDLENIPIDDKETYDLFSRGDTVGTFQFESPGMQKYLRELQPTQFEDIIAMNALYRPGPMAYIPSFIARKLGKEPIEYDIPVMEKYLKDTYGITVYQEQVMLLSQLLANFTKGQADTLRKAMGKKKIKMLEELKPKFIAGGKANGHDEKILEKIWDDWKKFASYAFNKSHATCYSWVAYQTAYLKAHFPAELMAANLTRNKDNITDVTKFMSECQRMKIPVLGPDINESELDFTTNKDGAIRFGMAGVKGVGENAVEEIVKERNKNGKYKNIFDFVERVNLNACNRKTIESLAMAGGFDSLGDIEREQIFATNEKGEVISDILVRYGNKYQSDKAFVTNSLFGDDANMSITRPALPKAVQWSEIERLNKEKELIGIYLSAHPLDEYFIEISSYCNITADELNGPLETYENKDLRLGGVITSTRSGLTQKGTPYGGFVLEDYSGSHEFMLFGKNYPVFQGFCMKNYFIMIEGTVQDRKADWKYYTPKEGESKQLEFKIKKIELLEDVAKKNISRINLRIPIENINEDLLSELETFITENTIIATKTKEDKVSLYIDIYTEIGEKIEMYSQSVKVKVNKPMKNFLKRNKQNKILNFTLS